MCVVVPAKNEEERIADCLDALAGQTGVTTCCYEVLLVLDGCTDSTVGIVEEWQRVNPNLILHALEGPDRGVGFARKLGMDTAYTRLVSTGGVAGLISSTDADSVVAEDWVSVQLRLAESGARAIGGRIQLEGGGGGLPVKVLDWYESQGRRRYEAVLAKSGKNGQDHWQFSGASMSVTAEVYRKIGGLGSVECLEDEHLERTLESAGVEIIRSETVRVTTSSRIRGRARAGLAADLARISGDTRTTG